MVDLVSALEAFEVELMCSICLCPMANSCSVAGCGHSFCRECIEHGLRVSGKCPLCKHPATKRSLRPNDIPRIDVLVSAVEEIRELVDGLDMVKGPGINGPSAGEEFGTEKACGFCGKSSFPEVHVLGVISLYLEGSLRYYAHAGCVAWTPDVYPNKATGELLNIKSGARRAKQQFCAACGREGATIGCCKKECKKKYHLLCAVNNSNTILYECNHELWCPEHSESAVKPVGNIVAEKDALSAKKSCLFCARSTGDLLCCDTCPQVMHLYCHEPPLIGTPLGSWSCPDCVDKGKDGGGKEHEREDVNMTHTGLDQAQKRELMKVARRMKAKVVADLSPDVTYVVTAARSVTETPRRTGKLLKAIATGRRIVSFEWILAASASSADTWPNSDPYELEGRGKYIRLTGEKPFANQSFYFGAYKREIPTRADLEEMITLGGGTLINHIPAEGDYNAYIVREKEEIGTKRRRVPLAPISRSIAEVNERWIMDRLWSGESKSQT